MFSILALSAYNPYIPWDTKIFEQGIAMLRQTIGTAFTVGMFIFFILMGIFVAIRIVHYIVG